MELPAAFDPLPELVTFLAKAKTKASAKFSLKKATSLRNANDLAYWLYVFKREDEALAVCEYLSQVQFTGTYELWNPVETTVALQARILRSRLHVTEADECVARIRKADFQEMRLEGGLLRGAGSRAGYLDQVESCLAEGYKTGVRDWRLIALKELCFVIELGGSAAWPVEKTESEFQTQLAELRSIMKVE